MNAPEKADQWVWLARVRRPQGRKGEVIADILTDFPEKFAERRRLWLIADSSGAHGESSPAGVTSKPGAGSTAFISPREVELTSHWLHKGGVVLHFAGVSSISDAEALAGMIVAIPREARVALAEDEVYIGDLIGCVLVDVAQPEAPVTVGEIADVDKTAGPVALLVLQGRSGEILVPFAKSFLRRVDVENKRVEMALPDGLVDLNAE